MTGAGPPPTVGITFHITDSHNVELIRLTPDGEVLLRARPKGELVRVAFTPEEFEELKRAKGTEGIIGVLAAALTRRERALRTEREELAAVADTARRLIAIYDSSGVVNEAALTRLRSLTVG